MSSPFLDFFVRANLTDFERDILNKISTYKIELAESSFEDGFLDFLKSEIAESNKRMIPTNQFKNDTESHIGYQNETSQYRNHKISIDNKQIETRVFIQEEPEYEIPIPKSQNPKNQIHSNFGTKNTIKLLEKEPDFEILGNGHFGKVYRTVPRF